MKSQELLAKYCAYVDAKRILRKLKRKADYKWKAWGYCSKCGFGSCKHLEEDNGN